MPENTLATKLRAGETVLGLCNMYPASGIIECMCRGWDFVWIDGQHGEMSYDSVLSAVQAARATGVESLIRVPGQEHCILGPFADLCPAAVMVPMVDNAEQAEHIVEGLRFPPRGKRSYGGRRAIDLGGRHYYREQELMVVAQIETLESVENAPDIIGLDGVDCLFFGPDDMRMRMQLPINTPAIENERLREAMEKTAAAATDAGKIAATVCDSVAGLKLALQLGYRMIVGGGDVKFLRILAGETLADFRKISGGVAKESPQVGEVY